MIAIMSEFIAALRRLPAKPVRVGPGECLFRQGDPIRHVYVVDGGCIHLRRDGEDGGPAVMQRATAGQLLAEASIFAAAYHCDAVAVAETDLSRYRRADIETASAADPDVMAALARHLAREVQRGRTRIEVLSRKTVRERLDAWLAFGGVLPARGGLATVAQEIGVSPEAFYRELQRRRAARA